MSAQGLVLIGRAGLQALRDRGWAPDAVGGLTMGADPVAYAIAAASVQSPPQVEAFSVRKEAKAHGTARRIEGNFATGSRVVVVEDVLTTGGSALQAVSAVRAEGGQILGVLTVVDREEGGREALESQDLEVVSLTTSSFLGLPLAADHVFGPPPPNGWKVRRTLPIGHDHHIDKPFERGAERKAAAQARLCSSPTGIGHAGRNSAGS